MCKKPVLNINIDNILGNLFHSRKGEVCFTVNFVCLFDKGIYLDSEWREGNFADTVGVPRKKKKQEPLLSIPLKKVQNSSFAPAKQSQSTQGLSLKAIKRIDTKTVLPPFKPL